MANTDITTNVFGNSVVQKRSAAEMAAALKQSASDGARGQLEDGGVYVSFSGKMGKYSIGVEKDDADPEELWLVNIYDFQRGFICWKGGRPVEKIMASVFDEPVPSPDPSKHGPFNSDRGEGWYPARSISFKSVDRGIQGLFQTNTKSAVSEFAGLEAKVADKMAEGAAPWPVVQLKTESFTAQGQKNYKPVLEVYGWLHMEQIQKMSEMGSVEEMVDSIDDLLAEADIGAATEKVTVNTKKKGKKKK